MPPVPQYHEYGNDDDDDDRSLRKYDTTDTILKDDASIEENKEVVLGSTEIYDKNGNLRLIPVYSQAFRMFFFLLTESMNLG